MVWPAPAVGLLLFGVPVAEALVLLDPLHLLARHLDRPIRPRTPPGVLHQNGWLTALVTAAGLDPSSRLPGELVIGCPCLVKVMAFALEKNEDLLGPDMSVSDQRWNHPRC